MPKRQPESDDGAPLKGGSRPPVPTDNVDMGEFEDEFEDEYESEDEILEAGVDGRPDAEREADEKAGMCAISIPGIKKGSSTLYAC